MRLAAAACWLASAAALAPHPNSISDEGAAAARRATGGSALSSFWEHSPADADAAEELEEWEEAREVAGRALSSSKHSSSSSHHKSSSSHRSSSHKHSSKGKSKPKSILDTILHSKEAHDQAGWRKGAEEMFWRKKEYAKKHCCKPGEDPKGGCTICKGYSPDARTEHIDWQASRDPIEIFAEIFAEIAISLAGCATGSPRATAGTRAT